MRGLAAFIMRGSLSAALVAATAAMLSLLFPPLLVVSGAALALVVLRRGWRQGVWVLTLTLVGGGAMARLALGTALPIVWIVAVYGALLLVLGMILRATISLALTMRVLALLGFAAVGGSYWLLGDPRIWWSALVQEMTARLQSEYAGAESEVFKDIAQMLTSWAPLMPGQFAASLVAMLLLALLLARGCQAMLYHPGGFVEEFNGLRLGRWFALGTLLVLGLTYALREAWLANLALVLAFIYLVQGVALVQGISAKLHLSKVWLVLFYVLMLLPYSQVIIMVAALIDAWVDFRTRVRTAPDSP
ncbi:MAG: DUF2232 domain-containing protein [Gammaproteobacteria bacterium]